MAKASRRIEAFASGEEARSEETVLRGLRSDAGIMDSSGEECVLSSVSISSDERPRYAVRALADARMEGGVR